MSRGSLNSRESSIDKGTRMPGIGREGEINNYN